MDAISRPPRRLRIGLCDTTLTGKPVAPGIRAAVTDTGHLLESLGHHVTPFLPRADVDGMMRAWTKIVACGTELSNRRALAGRDPETLLEGVARGAMRYAQTLSGADYLEAVAKIHAFGRQMAHAFDDHDILLTSTLAELPAKVGRFAHDTEDYLDYRLGPGRIFDYSPYCAAFNASGQPAASVPLQWSDTGLPIGIHLAAPFGADEQLIALCAELEGAKPWFHRRPPPISSTGLA
jgi:amidase/6-aminohexanoate-cyclic-dimer hydrolase